MPGTLYIVGTPIGNLEDMTFRAVRVLQEAAVVAAEDTRVTRKLLAHFDIRTPTMSYHAHSGPGRIAEVTALLRAGKDVALVSDAGMPGISDPGQALVAACVAENIPVVPVPGPSAIIAALAVSGFNTDRFRFLGFLPRATKARRALLRESLSGADTCAAYEAPHRVAEALADLADLASDHPVLLARELTKKFEELRRGTARELAEALAEAEVRGEIVLVWPGGGLRATAAEDPSARAVALARRYREDGLSTKDAAARAAAETGAGKRDVYQALLNGA
ncbi:MAG TPA: 16S rRNA (cytidine(1402)-2'-O)-methyltransferase [Armatimonadota bacterium]|nr:16S rRNA (cytidine(1402)-2'-O)-methyltransferase [Armatimonadota bacterium]HOS42077.1 16S rRNA (cytidine(1402)-2'-O)-methyltransferase [Armatimonadota bacterium]